MGERVFYQHASLMSILKQRLKMLQKHCTDCKKNQTNDHDKTKIEGHGRHDLHFCSEISREQNKIKVLR